MPTINFPSGPSLNDTYNLGVRTWKWNGDAWALQPLTGGFTGSQGAIGYTGSAGPNTLADSESIVLGTGSDFEILHDGSSSVIKDVQGNQLYIQSTNFNLANSSGLKHIYANDSYGVTLHYQDSAKLETTSNGVSITGVASLTNTTLSDSLLITTTEDSSTAGPVITLKRNSSSPDDADYLGQIKFKGENDADQEVIYAKITAKIDDATDGDEDGIIEITHKKAGANNISARWKSDKLMLINGTSLDVAGDITLSTVNNTTNIQIKDSSGNVLKTMYGTTS